MLSEKLTRKVAKIVKVDGKDKWYVKSEPGKKYDSYEAAKKRLDQIEMFKHMKGKKRKSFVNIAARIAGISSANAKQKMDAALKTAAKKDSRLASILGCSCGQEFACPACGATMSYDDGRDAYACPCGYSEPNGPALVSFGG